MPPSKVCPQCNAVVPIRLKVCRNRLKFALYNADRVNFKSRNYHVVAYNISILAEGLHFSALVSLVTVIIMFFLIWVDSQNFCKMKLYKEYKHIRASVDACGDGTSEISPDPHIQNRRESLARPSEHTNNNF